MTYQQLVHHAIERDFVIRFGSNVGSSEAFKNFNNMGFVLESELTELEELVGKTLELSGGSFDESGGGTNGRGEGEC